MTDTPTESRDTGEWDPLTTRLQQLRVEAGEPSYGEIARRVARLRSEAGRSEHEARVARTTVYDAFRTGRARVNLELVREIAAVLGGDDQDVDTWVAECRRQPAPVAPSPPEAPSEAPPETPSESPAESPAAVWSPPSLRLVLVLVALCVVVNVVGRFLVDQLTLPIHLDMVGTAIAAIALGPWFGAGVGLTSNLAGAAVSGFSSIPFALVNVAGALTWGYGVRRFAMGRSLPRFLGLNVLVAFVCSALAVPLLLWYFDTVVHSQNFLTVTFLELTGVREAAIALANLVVSLGDKIISGFLALVACSMLPLVLRRRTPLVLVSPDLGGPGEPPPADHRR